MQPSTRNSVAWGAALETGQQLTRMDALQCAVEIVLDQWRLQLDELTTIYTDHIPVTGHVQRLYDWGAQSDVYNFPTFVAFTDEAAEDEWQDEDFDTFMERRAVRKNGR